jgi:hypothetical protein
VTRRLLAQVEVVEHHQGVGHVDLTVVIRVGGVVALDFVLASVQTIENGRSGRLSELLRVAQYTSGAMDCVRIVVRSKKLPTPA